MKFLSKCVALVLAFCAVGVPQLEAALGEKEGSRHHHDGYYRERKPTAIEEKQKMLKMILELNKNPLYQEQYQETLAQKDLIDKKIAKIEEERASLQKRLDDAQLQFLRPQRGTGPTGDEKKALEQKIDEKIQVIDKKKGELEVESSRIKIELDNMRKDNKCFDKKYAELIEQLNESYAQLDAVEYKLLWAFAPELEGASIKGIHNIFAAAIATPVLKTMRDSLDKRLTITTESLTKWLFRKAKDFFVGIGFGSPLSLEKVNGWEGMVDRYINSMQKLSSSSATDSLAMSSFNARMVGRPRYEQEQLRISQSGKTEGDVPEDMQIAPDELEEEFKELQPVHYLVSVAMVRQLGGQISVMHDLLGKSEIEERLVLKECLVTLAHIQKAIEHSLFIDGNKTLTPLLSAELGACCDWLKSQFIMLRNLIDPDTNRENESTSSYSRNDLYGGGRRPGYMGY